MIRRSRSGKGWPRALRPRPLVRVVTPGHLPHHLPRPRLPDSISIKIYPTGTVLVPSASTPRPNHQSSRSIIRPDRQVVPYSFRPHCLNPPLNLPTPVLWLWTSIYLSYILIKSEGQLSYFTSNSMRPIITRSPIGTQSIDNSAEINAPPLILFCCATLSIVVNPFFIAHRRSVQHPRMNKRDLGWTIVQHSGGSYALHKTVTCQSFARIQHSTPQQRTFTQTVVVKTF
jgi:hypothetical protein